MPVDLVAAAGGRLQDNPIVDGCVAPTGNWSIPFALSIAQACCLRWARDRSLKPNIR